jgi:peptidoglycan/xylan/chitin deacetylase (PgdA/CDA1 family)
MSFRSQFGSLRRRILSGCCRRVVPLAAHGPIITFCFDDFPRTALTRGADILEAVGARATYYAAMSLMNTTTNLGEQFCDEDLFSVVERGHELASHTFSHLSARQIACDAFHRDVHKGELAIQERMRSSTSGNFAYPFGEVTLGVKKMLGSHFTSCRGTYGGVNGPDVDLNLLRANSLYGDLDRAEAAKKLVLENEERNGWLIFYSHDVTTKPSPYGCTPQLLADVCSFAASRDARLMTVAEVMKELGQWRDPLSEAGPQANEKSSSKSGLTYSQQLQSRSLNI